MANQHQEDEKQEMPLNLTDFKLRIERIESVRGRGGSTQYLVKLVGNQSMVWLKSSLVERPDLVREYHQRRNRERRAEARKKRHLAEGAQLRGIQNYFKPTGSHRHPLNSSRLSSSQPIRLSHLSIERPEENYAIGAMGSQRPNDDNSTFEWLLDETKPSTSIPEGSTTPLPGEERPAVASTPRTPPPSPPSKPVQEQELHREFHLGVEAVESGEATQDMSQNTQTRCNICNAAGLGADQFLSSLCGHMKICNNCTSSLLAKLYEENCFVCATATLFFLNLFEAVKALAYQMVTASPQEPNRQ